MRQCSRLNRNRLSRPPAFAAVEQRPGTEMLRKPGAPDTSTSQPNTTEMALVDTNGEQQMDVDVASPPMPNLSSQSQGNTEKGYNKNIEDTEKVADVGLLEESVNLDNDGQMGAIIEEYAKMVVVAREQAMIHQNIAPIFTPFPRLPLELRLRIWELACDHSSIIGVIYGWIRELTNPPVEVIQLLPAGPRNALHAVCRESRDVLNLFQTPYLTQLDMTKVPIHRRRRLQHMFDLSTRGGGIVYRNVEKDVILIKPEDWNRRNVGREWRSFGQLRANNTAFSYNNWKFLVDYSKGEDFMDELLSQGTKTVILVIGEPSMSTTQDTVLISPRRCPAKALSGEFWRNARQCNVHLPTGFVQNLKDHGAARTGPNRVARPWDHIEGETYRLMMRVRQKKYYTLIFLHGMTPEQATSRLHAVNTVKFAELTTKTELAARNQLHLAWD